MRSEQLIEGEVRSALMRPVAEVLFQRGVVQHSLDRFDEALASYDAALTLDPDLAGAWNNRGVVLHMLRRFDDAVASYRKALALQPDFVVALRNCGLALIELRQFASALASCDAALSICPDYPEALHDRGDVLTKLGRFEEAISSYDAALAIRPHWAEALRNRGLSLHELGRFEAALGSFDAALAIKADYVEALFNRANTLCHLAKLDEALASCDQAHALTHDDESAQYYKPTLKWSTLLQFGKFVESWREYEADRQAHPRLARRLDRPEWRGEDPQGVKFLFYAEYGLGDAIQFARFARAVAAKGGEVVLEVQPSLGALMRSLKGITVVRRGETLPEFDLHLPLWGLPFVLDATLNSIGADIPYLAAEPARIDKWVRQLPARSLNVGVAWQGNPSSAADLGRSAPLRLFEPLARVPGVNLVSLQKNAGTEQLDDLPAGMKVAMLGPDFDEGLDAFLDAAAVIANLDLVVTTDTSIAHLAGALGHPVWIALQRTPDSRWMLEREDTPWYPTARLFRQNRSGDWRELFERIAADLVIRAGKRDKFSKGAGRR